MGCALSKQDEEDGVVSLCRERKGLMKLAVERRYAFANAQCKYNQSLYAVAMALRLFVARHSSPSSQFLITFPSDTNGPNDNLVTNTNSMYLQQRPTEPSHEAISCPPSDSKVCWANFELGRQEQESQEDDGHDGPERSGEDEGSESEDGEVPCELFYQEVCPPMPPGQTSFGWDFFVPFEEMEAQGVMNSFAESSEEGLRAVREKEGIPELEEDEEGIMTETEVVKPKNGDMVGMESVVKDSRGEDDAGERVAESNGLIDTPTDGRELLEALKDIEDHFIRAYDSGLDVSRMLEANTVQLQSGLEEIKENSNKLIQSNAWNRSVSSRSSSCKSLLTSSSRSSSAWTESKNDLFDDFAMEAGSHSLTLGRLYAWEKKLFEEVKEGDKTRKIFERKYSHFRNQDATGDGPWSMDKSRNEVEDLHTRISVAIRSAESISEKIERLRDEELQPQLLELVHGLMRNWKIMLESHETQSRVMLEVKSSNFSAYGNFCNDSHRLATIQLEEQIDNWRASFAEYVSTQRDYVEALRGWLLKFIAPNDYFYSRGKSSLLPNGINGPPLLITCHNWLAFLEHLPETAVAFVMKSFAKDIHALWNQQGAEQQQKRKVDGLAKEYERRTLAFQREERRILESTISQQESEPIQNRMEYLAGRKNQLDMFKTRLETEKANHLTSMQETQRITINGLQTGFSSVFESLGEFCKASVRMYAHLVTYSANLKTTDENSSNLTSVEGMDSQAPS